MRALTFPFRVGPNGAIAVTETYTEIVRGQLIDVLMTNYTERCMRPVYGSNLRAALFDPADTLARGDAATLLQQRVKTWAPRVFLNSVTFSTDDDRPGALFIDVSYKATETEEARTLRLPVSTFLSEETPI